MEDVGVLSFSGGWQSSVIAWMCIRREIELPHHFAIVTADTGDERKQTYDYWRMMSWEFIKAGLHWIEAPGPKIPDEWSADNTSTRIDTIPYWTSDNGKRGKLMHACTRYYKIWPMRRATTRWLSKRLCVSKGKAERIPVTSWIGMAADEQDRFEKIETTRTWLKRAPLIERGMTKQDCVDYIRGNGLPEPIMSVCAGCFSHGLKSLKWMYDNDPVAWERIKQRDNWVRYGMKQFGVRLPVYISHALIPLQQLEDQGFKLADRKENAKHQCDSGVCFT